MGKDKAPDTPTVPDTFIDQNLVTAQNLNTETGTGLSRGTFANPNDPTLGFLAPLVSLNPEATQRAVALASRDVVDQQERVKQDTLNQLEANNQLTSSVTGNRLGDLDEAFSSDIADIATNAYLADVERVMTNTRSLFGAGIDTLSDVASKGLSNQAQRNTFNQNRFNNQLAVNQLEAQNERGGFGGAISGLVGGALGGLTLGGGGVGAALGGLAGGTAGFFAPQGGGSAIQSAGFGLAQTDRGLDAIEKLRRKRSGGIFGLGEGA